MSFWQRLSTLARADAHGMVEALEDERLVLRQHLRDAQAAVAGKQAQLESMDAELRNLQRTQHQLKTKEDTLEADVELALAENRDDLARYTIQQLLPIRRRILQTAERSRHVEQSRKELQEIVNDQESRLEELKDRVRVALEAEASEPWLQGSDLRVTDEEVELELLRRRSQQFEDADFSGSRSGSETDHGS